MTRTICDATGRTIALGDTVGGTTSGRYQSTITGPIIQTGADKIKLIVTNHATVGSQRAQNGDDVWISTDRVYLVHPANERHFFGFRTPDGHVWTVAPRTKGATLLYEAPWVAKRYEATGLRQMYNGALEAVWTLGTPEAVLPVDAMSTHAGAAALRSVSLRLWEGCGTGTMSPDVREEAAAFLSRVAAEVTGRARTKGHPQPVDERCVETPASILNGAFLQAAAHLRGLAQDFELDPGRGDSVSHLLALAGDALGDTYPPAFPWARLLDDDDLDEFIRDLGSVITTAVVKAHGTPRPQLASVLAGLEEVCTTWRRIAEAQFAHNTAPGPDRT